MSSPPGDPPLGVSSPMVVADVSQSTDPPSSPTIRLARTHGSSVTSPSPVNSAHRQGLGFVADLKYDEQFPTLSSSVKTPLVAVERSPTQTKSKASEVLKELVKSLHDVSVHQPHKSGQNLVGDGRHVSCGNDFAIRDAHVSDQIGGGEHVCVSADVDVVQHQVKAMPEKRDDHTVTQPSYSAIVGSGMMLVQNHKLETELVNGEHVGIVPEDVVRDIPPLWSDLLVGRFASKAPHVGKVHMIVNKIWPLGNKDIKIDAHVVNEHMIKFRIRDERTRKRVIRRGMWNIAGIPMFLSKWAPADERDDLEVKIMPVWVKLQNVPRSMFQEQGIFHMARAVGRPIRLHPETELCNNFTEAKVLVEVDLMKKLPTSHKFRMRTTGIEFSISFQYPWIPNRCEQCNQWGHKQEACVLTKPTTSEEQGLRENKAGNEDAAEKAEQRNEEGDSESGSVQNLKMAQGSTQKRIEAKHEDTANTIGNESQIEETNEQVDAMAKEIGVPESKILQPQSQHFEEARLEETRDNQGLTPQMSNLSKQPSSQIEKMELEIRSAFCAKQKWEAEVEEEIDGDEEANHISSESHSEYSVASTRSLRPRIDKKYQHKKQKDSGQKSHGKKGRKNKTQTKGKKEQEDGVETENLTASMIWI